MSQICVITEVAVDMARRPLGKWHVHIYWYTHASLTHTMNSLIVRKCQSFSVYA